MEWTMSFYLKDWQWAFVVVLFLSLAGGLWVFLENTKEVPLAELQDRVLLPPPGGEWDQ